ncbi:hypothetical protein FKW77_002196 [Venturia effusa]|uniref:Uncharacterized protein n=1 Tax=Venturia effusa TaxID=50376 RepID=A0A517LMB6_9PEZI|nr:hypothetical protein FKW77_002196 [Venturia effusa]
MAIRSISSISNKNFTVNVRSVCKELKRKIPKKKARITIRLTECDSAEEDQKLLSKARTKTREEIEDTSIATYLAMVREYRVHQWPADRRRFGRAPYDEMPRLDNFAVDRHGGMAWRSERGHSTSSVIVNTNDP